MKNSIIRQCLDIFKHEDIKNELKLLINPLVEFIFYEIRKYQSSLSLNGLKLSSLSADIYPYFLFLFGSLMLTD